MKGSASFLMALLSTSAIAAEAPKTYRSIGADFNAQVLVAPSQKSGYYLLQFNGFEHEIDGQTRLYKKVLNNSSNIEDGYHYLLAGSNMVNFRNNIKRTLQNGNYIPTVQIYLTDKPITNMVYRGPADITSPRKLQVKYQARQGLSDSKIAAKQHIKQANSRLIKACYTNLSIDVDWHSFEQIDAKTTPGMLTNYLNSLSKLCEQDKDYQAEIQSIDTISVKASDKEATNSVIRDNKELIISLTKSAPNVTETSYTDLIDVL